MHERACNKNRTEAIALTIFVLDYAALVLFFIIMIYNVRKARDDHKTDVTFYEAEEYKTQRVGRGPIERKRSSSKPRRQR